MFTPTEASAVAVFYALVVGKFLYGTLKFDMLPASSLPHGDGHRVAS